MSQLRALAWALSLALVVIVASGCGVTQHNYIAHKAMTWFYPASQGAYYAVFQSILEDHQDAFQNGAAFPDWGYDCGNFGDASEAAHWPPFTLASSIYVSENCGPNPANWTVDCQKLSAFLFGMVSHQIADVLWHDLAAVSSTQQGFIQTMGNTDFGGSYSDAHSVADTGGEFIVAREYDLSFILANWYFPKQAISDIYQKIGYDVTPENLEVCNLLLYAEVHAVVVGGALLYDYAASRSPFLTDQIQDYWMGGIDDNAVWTLWCWSDYFIYWQTPSSLEDISNYPLCTVQAPLFSSCPRCSSSRPRYEPRSPLLDRITKHLVASGAVGFKELGNGAIQYELNQEQLHSIVKSEIEHDYAPTLPISNQDQGARASSCYSGFSQATLAYFGNSSNDYGYVGRSFSSGDLNGDQIDDLVVGIPGYMINNTPQLGGVYVLFGSAGMDAAPQNRTLPKTPTLVGQGARERFGWASAVLDMNQDGFNDLVISSPGYSAENLTYLGRLSVFFGNNAGGFASQPDVIFYTQVNFTNLGQNFYTYDCDQDGYLDLLVGSYYAGKGTASGQQNGKVHLVLSSSSFTSGSAVDIDDVSTVILEESQPNSWFGKHIRVTVLSSGQRLLIVGAPVWNQNPGDSSSSENGMVISFDLDSLLEGKSASVFEIYGDDVWDQVGDSFSVGPFGSHDSVLALSAPAFKNGIDQGQEGSVFLFDISSLTGSHSVNSLKNLAQIQGNEKYARFGWGAEFVESSPGNYTFWISEPRKSIDDRAHEAGVVYEWSTSKLPDRPGNPVDSCDSCYSSPTPLIRFGESWHFADLDGNGLKDVIIGAPRWGDTLVGAFTIIFN